MKKTLSTFFLLGTLFAAESQPHISGRIDLSEKWGKRIYVLRLDQIDLNLGLLVDSISLSEAGEFRYSFKSDQSGGLLYKLVLPPAGKDYRAATGGTDDNYILLTIEDRDTIVFNANADSLFYTHEVKGKEVDINKTLSIYRDHSKPFFNLIRALNDSIARDPEHKEAYVKRFVPMWMDQIEEIKAKIIQTLDTATNTSVIMAGLCHLNSAYLGTVPHDILQEYLSKVNHTDLPLVQNTIELAKSSKANRLGLQLPDFHLKDLGGSDHSLFDITKRFTVIDFWASWCSPCRQANKNGLPEIYKSIESRKDIQFISVSIDKNSNRWKRAVMEDTPMWPQYIDEDRRLVRLLSAYGVPLYLVLNDDRRIIFETMSHYHLDHFLKSLNKE